jgi:integrase
VHVHSSIPALPAHQVLTLIFFGLPRKYHTILTRPVGYRDMHLNAFYINYGLVMAVHRASTTRLASGDHSIDRATPRKRGDVWLLDWSVRLHDGMLKTRRSQGATKGQVRQRAKASAAEMLATGGGAWKTTSSIDDYIEQVSRPAIASTQLRPNSRSRYDIALRQLMGGCKEHSHAHSLKGHSIGSGTRFRALEACLQEIAKLHGAESAKQARTVLSKYVLQQLIRDELATGNPLSGMSIDLKSDSKPNPKTRGGQALTREEYDAVLDYLLALDPAVGQIEQRRSRWSLNDRVAKRRNVIDLTLLQSATGLRISEANGLTWTRHIDTDGDIVHVTVTEDISKTHRERRVPVLDDSVAKHLLARQRAMSNSAAYVIGSPADSTKAWDRRNSGGEVNKLYLEIAEALEIPLLLTARSHVWRATLNSLLLDDVPEVTRAAYFGHEVAVNRGSYTDLTDTSRMVAAARRLRAGEQ